MEEWYGMGEERWEAERTVSVMYHPAAMLGVTVAETRVCIAVCVQVITGVDVIVLKTAVAFDYNKTRITSVATRVQLCTGHTRTGKRLSHVDIFEMI